MNNSWHIIQQGAVIVIVGERGEKGKEEREKGFSAMLSKNLC